ncbi:hypothetical protein LVY65_07170 [Sphingomonas sp. G124]|uniref:Uncharacterized protein n=1 Tax=Sphingomonas cremea TaxID=2904799 RepID=A0A9X1QJF8_9SPHN|nr:hypothetical protein [Sphingomonas cremea]MCF2514843.1 hypothetical protein [Sphingomonas cremea]
MGTFDYITVLVAVVVGLAIADQALSLHRLLRDRRRVQWDWVAPLAALLILTELFNFWWQWRGFTGSTLGDIAPYFLALIVLFLTAAITLPDQVPEGGIDLGRYFDENRAYFWALYGTYLLVYIPLIVLRKIEAGRSASEILQDHYFDFICIVGYFVMTRVKPRWISGAVMIVTLAWLIWGFDWWNRPLASPA